MHSNCFSKDLCFVLSNPLFDWCSCAPPTLLGGSVHMVTCSLNILFTRKMAYLQTCQVSWLCRESHDLKTHLTLFQVDIWLLMLSGKSYSKKLEHLYGSLIFKLGIRKLILKKTLITCIWLENVWIYHQLITELVMIGTMLVSIFLLNSPSRLPNLL